MDLLLKGEALVMMSLRELQFCRRNATKFHNGLKFLRDLLLITLSWFSWKGMVVVDFSLILICYLFIYIFYESCEPYKLGSPIYIYIFNLDQTREFY